MKPSWLWGWRCYSDFSYPSNSLCLQFVSPNLPLRFGLYLRCSLKAAFYTLVCTDVFVVFYLSPFGAKKAVSSPCKAGEHSEWCRMCEWLIAWQILGRTHWCSLRWNIITWHPAAPVPYIAVLLTELWPVRIENNNNSLFSELCVYI